MNIRLIWIFLLILGISLTSNAKKKDKDKEKKEKKVTTEEINYAIIKKDEIDGDEIIEETKKINKNTLNSDLLKTEYDKYSSFLKECIAHPDLEVETEINKKWFIKLTKYLDQLKKVQTYYHKGKLDNNPKIQELSIKAGKNLLKEFKEVIKKPKKISKERMKKLREEKKIRDKKKREKEKREKARRKKNKKKKNDD